MILDELLLNQEDEAEILMALDKISEDMIGYITLQSLDKVDILDAVKDTSGTALYAWLTKNIDKIQFTQGRTLPKGSIPIAIPSTEAKTHRLTLSLIFNVFNLKLNERQTYVLAMMLILTPKVPSILKRISQVAILDDGAYTIRQMGLKGVFEIDPMFCSVRVSKLVNAMFTLYGERMFKDADPNVRDMLIYTFNLFDVAYFMRDTIKRSPNFTVKRNIKFVPSADSGQLMPVLKQIEDETERKAWLADTSDFGHPVNRYNTFMAPKDFEVVKNTTIDGFSATLVVYCDFASFSRDYRPARTMFLAQLRRITERWWIQNNCDDYYQSVLNKWKTLGYDSVPVAENEDEAKELLKIYLKGITIVYYIEEETDIEIPTKTIFSSESFQSRFHYSKKFWNTITSNDNPSYAVFVELIKENEESKFDSRLFPTHNLSRQIRGKTIYGSETTIVVTEDEIATMYAKLVGMSIERLKEQQKLIQIIPESIDRLNDIQLTENHFDPNFGIDYCPCCFGAYRLSVKYDLVCGHSICPDCTIRMNEYKSGDFFESWKHLCPLCRTKLPYPKNRFGSQLEKSVLDPQVIYRFCTRDDCSILSMPGTKSCSHHSDEFSAYCDVHSVKNQFPCPNCQKTLEYAGGCLSFYVLFIR